MTAWLGPAVAVGVLVLLGIIWRLRAEARHLASVQVTMRSSEERYRTLFQFTTDGVICHDADGKVIAANPAAEAILGISASEMFTLGPWVVWQDLLYPDGHSYAPSDIPCAVALSRAEHVKDTIVGTQHWASGAAVWLQLESIPLCSAGESKPSQVIAVFMDVTEQRRAEGRFRVIVDSSPNALLMIDHKGVIALANSASERTFGYTQEELIGQSVDMLVPNSHRPNHSDLRHHYLASANARPIGAFGELQALRKDGTLIPVDIGLSPIATGDGEFTLATVVDITERKEAERAMSKLAYFDALTGLPNRRLLIERLQHALTVSVRRQRYGALLFLDVDNFKTINDIVGHDAGDLMLQEVATRQQANLRQSDTIARIGGDEFVVLLEELDNTIGGAASYAKEVADKLLASLSQPYRIRGREFPGSVSIGVALWGSDATEDVNDLLRRSDMAMYDAKKAGRNTVRFFDPEMQEILEKRTSLESDLHRAIVEKQFLLHFQKRVRADGRLQGAEALLRWQHPERGLVSPMEFIPLAEETGLIVPIGQWVLETACRQLVDWEEMHATRTLMLSVNISALEFKQENFVDNVRWILSETGANPARLELEITESMLLGNVEIFIAKMKALRELGVSFALDDFGTGYSSLSYLKRLPLNILKIDKSFVSEIGVSKNDETIVQTIIRMGQTLGLAVIAEGVETEAQRDILEHHGCDNFQGFLFGKPVSIQGFEQELQQALVAGR
jgi:diguanylate cyclase (GGDEF)-like protein/PAS domain S-box-containing protein